MPKLSELTDYAPPQQERIYVSPYKPEVLPTNDSGDYFTKPVAPMPELPADNFIERFIKKLAETEVSAGTKIGNKLFGTGGEERYQLWPEKIVRSALTAIPDAYSGKIPMHDVDPETGELKPSEAMISRALDMASFAGVGGVGGTGAGAGTALGASPFLRPALKYKDRLYKGKEGQQHMDVIPPNLYNEFQRMAMSGEDISHYNFGFYNDRGHFLDREAALKYGIETGLIDPQAGKFGALTSTLLADSSKPGTAIEAVAKTGGVDPIHFQSVEAAKFRLGQLQRDKAASKKAGEDVNSSDYMFYNTQIRALKEYIKNPEEFNKGAKYKFKPVDHIPEF